MCNKLFHVNNGLKLLRTDSTRGLRLNTCYLAKHQRMGSKLLQQPVKQHMQNCYAAKSPCRKAPEKRSANLTQLQTTVSVTISSCVILVDGWDNHQKTILYCAKVCIFHGHYADLAWQHNFQLRSTQCRSKCPQLLPRRIIYYCQS